MKISKVIEDRYDSKGVLIKEYDVLKDIETDEIVIVIKASNNLGVSGLAVENDVIGIKDWLDVYPDGVWEAIGNLSVAAEY